MKVEARNLLVKNLFTKGEFIIPEYQREFDWDDEEIDEFLDDINETDDDNYFIGHMVFEGDFNKYKFYVIDGQQRITTLTISLCVIRDLFFEMGESDLAHGLNDNYIFRRDENNKKFVVLKNDMPYPVLHRYVQDLPNDKDKNIQPAKSGERKIIHAYNKIYNLAKTLQKEQLITLRDKILSLEFIFVAADEQVNAQTIFMTLNGTGKDLTPVDLIKGQIFLSYPSKDEPHLKEPNESWKKIIENTSGRTGKFFNNFWASRYKKVSDKKIFKEFLKNKPEVKPFLLNLLSDSELYKKIISPQKEDWNNDEYQIYYSINAITQIFNIEVANSLLLSLIRDYSNKKIAKDYLIKCLSTIEKYHFINNAVCSNRSSGLDTMYAKVAKDITFAEDKHKRHKIIDNLKKSLDGKIPTIEEFAANFANKLYYSIKETKQKKLVQYVLNKIEYNKNPNSITIGASLEHIYPENPSEEWKKNVKKSYVKDIANIVLLDASLNSKMGNIGFDKKKRKIIEKSHLITTKEVFQNKDLWGEKEIDERRETLINLLYSNIWE